jgi:ADP-heptose:LPS heptosyltransferase
MSLRPRPDPSRRRLRPVAEPDDRMADLDHIDHIAVLRALPGLGDMVCAVPSLRALRHRFPRARVALIGLWSSRWMLDGYPHYLDELLPIDGLPLLCPPPPDTEGAMAALNAAREQRFDLAVQLHGDGSLSNLVTTLLGARANLVHHLPGQPAPEGAIAVPYAGRGHEVVRLLDLVEHLGVVGDAQLEPPTYESQGPGRQLVATLPVASGGLAVLHPGASTPARRWPAAGFAAVARYLLERDIVVVATGTESERPVVEELCRREPGVIDLCGHTGACDLAGVLSGARLVVSNDTGVAHLAAAVRAPSVVTFLGDDPGRWAPIDSVRHRVVLLANLPEARRGTGLVESTGWAGGGAVMPVLPGEAPARGLLDGELAAVLGAVADQLASFPPPGR